VVLTRISDKRKTAIAGYSGFVAAGRNHGRREDLRGGGLIRSIGGLAAMMIRGAEERKLSDEWLLGSGDFVESVLRDSDNSSESGKPYIDVKEVSEKSGISGEQILEPSRSRKVSNARKQFFYRA
jgi:putative transposase